jgi:hypothetical protein
MSGNWNIGIGHGKWPRKTNAPVMYLILQGPSHLVVLLILLQLLLLLL